MYALLDVRVYVRLNLYRENPHLPVVSIVTLYVLFSVQNGVRFSGMKACCFLEDEKSMSLYPNTGYIRYFWILRKIRETIVLTKQKKKMTMHVIIDNFWSCLWFILLNWCYNYVVCTNLTHAPYFPHACRDSVL